MTSFAFCLLRYHFYDKINLKMPGCEETFYMQQMENQAGLSGPSVCTTVEAFTIPGHRLETIGEQAWITNLE